MAYVHWIILDVLVEILLFILLVALIIQLLMENRLSQMHRLRQIRMRGYASSVVHTSKNVVGSLPYYAHRLIFIVCLVNIVYFIDPFTFNDIYSTNVTTFFSYNLTSWLLSLGATLCYFVLQISAGASLRQMPTWMSRLFISLGVIPIVLANVSAIIGIYDTSLWWGKGFFLFCIGIVMLCLEVSFSVAVWALRDALYDVLFKGVQPLSQRNVNDRTVTLSVFIRLLFGCTPHSYHARHTVTFQTVSANCIADQLYYRRPFKRTWRSFCPFLRWERLYVAVDTNTMTCDVYHDVQSFEHKLPMISISLHDINFVHRDIAKPRRFLIDTKADAAYEFKASTPDQADMFYRFISKAIDREYAIAEISVPSTSAEDLEILSTTNGGGGGGAAGAASTSSVRVAGGGGGRARNVSSVGMKASMNRLLRTYRSLTVVCLPMVALQFAVSLPTINAGGRVHAYDEHSMDPLVGYIFAIARIFAMYIFTWFTWLPLRKRKWWIISSQQEEKNLMEMLNANRHATRRHKATTRSLISNGGVGGGPSGESVTPYKVSDVDSLDVVRGSAESVSFQIDYSRDIS